LLLQAGDFGGFVVTQLLGLGGVIDSLVL
jgi:hypothetical protein